MPHRDSDAPRDADPNARRSHAVQSWATSTGSIMDAYTGGDGAEDASVHGVAVDGDSVFGQALGHGTLGPDRHSSATTPAQESAGLPPTVYQFGEAFGGATPDIPAHVVAGVQQSHGDSPYARYGYPASARSMSEDQLLPPVPFVPREEDYSRSPLGRADGELPPIPPTAVHSSPPRDQLPPQPRAEGNRASTPARSRPLSRLNIFRPSSRSVAAPAVDGGATVVAPATNPLDYSPDLAYGDLSRDADELDVIDSYEPNDVPMDRAGSRENAMDSILDEYQDAGTSTTRPHSGLIHQRKPTQPDTPSFDRHTTRALMFRGDAPDANMSTSTIDLYGGGGFGSDVSLDMPRSRRGSTSERPGTRDPRKYAPGGFAPADQSLNHSLLSFAEQSGDQYALPSDYKSQVFLGDGLDQLHGGDRDWDEKPPKFKDHMSVRGFANVAAIVLLLLAVLMLFLGYPVLTKVRSVNAANDRLRFLGKDPDSPNSVGNQQYLRTSLVDPDTEEQFLTRTNLRTGKRMKLVFSDEFNRDGRSFYDGDDPFWMAEDLHYWQTENYEWYDPDSVTTADGNLVITLSQKPEHALNLRGGLLTSWNRMCFTGGYIETRLRLPGKPNVTGLWPAVWTMGNLGRAGYGASTEGLWPYSYDTCDVGTMPNQTYLASQGGGPVAAETTGHYIEQYGPSLSYLPGQRLSRCTCPDSDDHPGPKHRDGTWVGRSAPEIDIIEASANNGENEHGQASMSLQVAPFDAAYNVSSDPDAMKFYEPGSTLNSYTGSAFQQAVSTKVNISDSAYEGTDGQFERYGFEYDPTAGDDSYITWTMGGQERVTLNAAAIGPNPATEIGPRLIPREPMYILFNLGIAASFTYVNWPLLEFPTHLKVDYVRVWQDEDNVNIGCDPDDFPTAEYIKKHLDAYYNTQYTSWLSPPDQGGYNTSFPGNMLMGQCG
ncbi:hypothetical protein MSPP1_002239 [Malassezia sp. CBS 17886]|nr:hypothetical protein MSPP1_002239 [Malassezia sp. CBS 17886]